MMTEFWSIDMFQKSGKATRVKQKRNTQCLCHIRKTCLSHKRSVFGRLPTPRLKLMLWTGIVYRHYTTLFQDYKKYLFMRLWAQRLLKVLGFQMLAMQKG